MRRRVTWSMSMAILLLVAGGCAAPFSREPLQPLGDLSAGELLARAREALPAQLTSEDSVVVHSILGKQAVIGVLAADREADTFDLVGLNHMGVALFHVRDKRGEIEILSALGPLQSKPEILRSLAADVRNIYMKQLPPRAHDVKRTSRSVCLHDESGRRVVHYKLAAPDGRLIEKSLTSRGRPLWRVRYYGYSAASGKNHPGEIVLDNHVHHYRLVIRNRSWQATDSREPGHE